MNDTLDERLLADHLHRFAELAPLPATPVADDVRRGRVRLRRRRAVVTAGSAAVVLALAAGGFSLADGPNDGRPALADQPTAVDRTGIIAPPKGASASDALVRELEALRDDSAEADGLRFTLAELSAVTDLLQDRLRGDRVLWVDAGRASSWKAAGALVCPSGWTCDDVAVRGATRARLASSGTVRQVVAEFPARVVVLTFNTVDERPAHLAYDLP